MRKHYFLKSLLTLLLVFVGANMWAQDEIIDMSAQGYVNGVQYKSTAGIDCLITYAGGANDGKYYDTGTGIRIYGNGSFTVSSSTKKIVQLVLTFSGKNYAPEDASVASEGTLDVSSTTQTWNSTTTAGTGSVTFTRPSGKGHWRLQKVAVTYAADDGRTPTATTFTNGEPSYDVFTGDAFTAPTATVDNEGTVTYSSSKPEVATVDAATGAVTLVAPGTTIIRAEYAGDETYAPSSASYTLNVGLACSTMLELQNAATTTEIPVKITFNNIHVTGLKGTSQVYISDGVNGALIYTNNHGLNVNDVLNGTIMAKLVLYNGSTEIIDFTKDGLTITTEEQTPAEVTIADITLANQSRYVLVKGVKYSSGTFTDATGTIKYFNGLNTSLGLVDGKTYNITGIVTYFNVLQISALTAEESNAVSLEAVTAPAETLTAGTSDSYQLNYNDDGAITVASSQESVASVSYNAATKTVTVNALAAGTTEITVSAAAGSTYSTPTSFSYELTVTPVGEESVTFNYNDEGISGQGTSGGTGGGFTVTNGKIELETSNAFGYTNCIKVYAHSDLTVSAEEGYAVSEVTLVGTSGYIKTWKDQTGADVTINGNDAIWTGLMPYVVLTNQDGAQARLTDIIVKYVPLEDTGIKVTISDKGKGTYCATGKCVVGNGKVTKYITGVEENGTTLIESDASVIADGEGVMLSGDAGTYKVYTHASLAPAASADNKLVGCKTDTSVPTGSYVMQDLNDVVAFYIVSAEAPVTCPAGKAYLTLASGAKALFFGDSETTAIENISNVDTAAKEDIYTISGVKVDRSNMTKGIYVVNGRKVVVK